MTTEEVFQLIVKERSRQDEKWGKHSMPPGMELQILGEEFGEVCQALCNEDLDNLKEELVQVAAVAFKWLEYLKELPPNAGGGRPCP